MINTAYFDIVGDFYATDDFIFEINGKSIAFYHRILQWGSNEGRIRLEDVKKRVYGIPC